MEPWGGLNLPPIKPNIEGPTSGIVGIMYNFSFSSLDPNSDNIYFWIDWGDGSIEEWIGPYNSGEKIIINHTWKKKDDYIIKAKSKDASDAEGPWGSLQINIPRPKVFSFIQILVRIIQKFPVLEHIFSVFPMYSKITTI